MIAQKLLDRLDGVKKTTDHHWRSKCPAHGSKGGTLSITEKDDCVVIHCFAGCQTDHILGTVGLDFSDLFPDELPARKNGDRNGVYADKFRPPRIPAKDVLDCLCDEVTVAAHYIDRAARGEKLFREDVERFQTCRNRIRAAREYIE